MQIIELTTQAVALLRVLVPLLKSFVSLVSGLLVSSWRTGPWSYENLLLDLRLDLHDPSGQSAFIKRKQRVRFLTDEAGVLACPMWGDGVQLKRLELKGAKRLGLRPDGPRQDLLLGLAHPAKRYASALVTARESLDHAFLRNQEYFEATVERPTQSLRLEVVFPKERPPTSARLVSDSGANEEVLPIRLGRDARAKISWRLTQPQIRSVYSVRWSW